MSKHRSMYLLLVILLIPLVSGCSLTDMFSGSSGPTSRVIPTATPLPAAEVVFSASPPADTTSKSDLALVVVDEVTGLDYNTVTHEMKRQKDGHWEVHVAVPVSSVLHYRYTRQSPSPIATWSDAAYQGPVGRIIGQLTDQADGSPLAEMVVVVAGVRTFSDGEGNFRIEGLQPGLHQLVVFSPTGAYQTVQQGALIAADSTTPIALQLSAAQRVQVTFEISVPEDTIPGIPLRIAGNVQQMGNVFSPLSGGVNLSVAKMPEALLVTPTDYISVVTLYSGTDLRYKYTLGDGFWNAERDPDGYFLTRQLIVPDYDIILKDVVATWHGGSKGSVQFNVTVPADTPPGEQISLQLNPYTWFEPIPMWPQDENQWFYVLHGPLDFSGTIGYRYCRNGQCGSADDIETAGSNSMGRPLTPSRDTQQLHDEVTAWWWLSADSPSTTIIAPAIEARNDYEVGVELVSGYHPNLQALTTAMLGSVVDLGSNAIVLTPSWVLEENEPTPNIAFDPARAPFAADLENTIREATKRGLEISLRPTLSVEDGSLQNWWLTAPRDSAWWDVWFEEYRSFILTYARLAERNDVSRLVLGGVETMPALPGGLIAGDISSEVPMDAEHRWLELITEIGEIYDGELAFQIELSDELEAIPNFMVACDAVYVYWHALLATTEDEGSASACAKAPDETCRDNTEFEQGAIVDPDLGVDLLAQAQALNAVLLEATVRDEIQGFFVRGYNPSVVLQDKSASIYGKPGRDVIWYWYSRLTGVQ
ncbi:MAG: carboxypeptidase regulatory-like domain-containing protein [Anaerolineales bacterium]